MKLGVALQAAQGFAMLFRELGEENKTAAIAAIVIEKAAAVAQIIANTAIANAKMVAAFPITGGLPWTAINTAGAVASIAATVLAARRAIGEVNTDAPSLRGAGGGLSGLSGGTRPPAPSEAPQMQSPVQNVQERAPQQLMAAPMVKTYVLTGDITSGQEAQAKLNTKRTIS